MRVGFVGASGLMGHGMAKNLVAAGHDLHYTVRTREPAGLAEAGATRAADLAALGRECEVVFICVTSAADVEATVTGPGGLLTDPRDGLVIVDSSTSDPGTTLRLSGDCAASGVSFIDAPLTRGPAEAEAGRLNVLVGAAPEDLARIRPLLDTFAENVVHAGPTGAGHTVKLLNNFVVQAHATALAEAFAVSAKVGVDPSVLVDILSRGPADNRMLANMAATLDGDFTAMQFGLDNARKDVRYYTRLAADAGVPTSVGDGVHEQLALASALGFGGEFVPSLVKGQAKLNGVRIGGAGPS